MNTMLIDNLKERDFTAEFHFAASRSGGPGGQNVNKVNTKVELRFVVSDSILLSDQEKQLIREKLANKINLEGELIIVSQTERSQLKNKVQAIERFYQLIAFALTPRKKRKPTRPTRASKERRLDSKRKQAEKKSNRRFLN